MDHTDRAVQFACALIASGHYPTYQSKDAACLICQQAWALTQLIEDTQPEHLRFEGIE